MSKVVYNSCYGGFTLSGKARKILGLGVNEHGEPIDPARHDPALVELVESMGDEASGDCSQLSIAKICGRFYKIENHDGYESVVDLDDGDSFFVDNEKDGILRDLVASWDVADKSEDFAHSAAHIVRRAREILGRG